LGQEASFQAYRADHTVDLAHEISRSIRPAGQRESRAEFVNAAQPGAFAARHPENAAVSLRVSEAARMRTHSGVFAFNISRFCQSDTMAPDR
ncbi:MAG TPA: hypothetical protein VEF36_07940, partial [Roseiarcus sp.]|nr:hypothetical protein [Roseiarcus sp.]